MRGQNKEHSGAGNASATSQLYHPSSTFPLPDYQYLLNVARGKHSALEFGPGYSTYALIEAGCEKIISCEDNPEWAEKKREEFKDYSQVSIVDYENAWPVALISGDMSGQFDIAFVDAPTMVERPIVTQPPIKLRFPNGCARLNTMLAALERAPLVICDDALDPNVRASLGHISGLGHKVSFILGGKGMARIERA